MSVIDSYCDYCGGDDAVTPKEGARLLAAGRKPLLTIARRMRRLVVHSAPLALRTLSEGLDKALEHWNQVIKTLEQGVQVPERVLRELAVVTQEFCPQYNSFMRSREGTAVLMGRSSGSRRSVKAIKVAESTVEASVGPTSKPKEGGKKSRTVSFAMSMAVDVDKVDEPIDVDEEPREEQELPSQETPVRKVAVEAQEDDFSMDEEEIPVCVETDPPKPATPSRKQLKKEKGERSTARTSSIVSRVTGTPGERAESPSSRSRLDTELAANPHWDPTALLNEVCKARPTEENFSAQLAHVVTFTRGWRSLQRGWQVLLEANTANHPRKPQPLTTTQKLGIPVQGHRRSMTRSPVAVGAAYPKTLSGQLYPSGLVA